MISKQKNILKQFAGDCYCLTFTSMFALEEDFSTFWKRCIIFCLMLACTFAEEEDLKRFWEGV